MACYGPMSILCYLISNLPLWSSLCFLCLPNKKLFFFKNKRSFICNFSSFGSSHGGRTFLCPSPYQLPSLNDLYAMHIINTIGGTKSCTDTSFQNIHLFPWGTCCVCACCEYNADIKHIIHIIHYISGHGITVLVKTEWCLGVSIFCFLSVCVDV